MSAQGWGMCGRIWLRSGLMVLVCVVVLGGCGSNVSQVNQSALKATRRVPEPMVPSSPVARTSEVGWRDYVIGPQDLLEISFYEIEDLNESKTVSVRVSEEGMVMLPLLGNVRAGGRTAKQVRREIEQKLGERYLVNPQVSVALKEYRSKRVSVLGAVGKPGVYKLRRNETRLMNVLSMAGGPTEFAGRLVFVVRGPSGSVDASAGGAEHVRTVLVSDATSGEGPVETVELAALLERGDAGLNIPVYDGDVVHVPKVGSVYVTGHVKAPGGFAMRKNLTVLQAVTLAGGLREAAAPSRARLVRGRRGGDETIEVDLAKIASGQSEDIMLVENDVLEVPSDRLASFSRGVLRLFSGVFGVGFSLN